MFNGLSNKYSRSGLIKMAGAIGIILNLFLAGLKLFIGTIANSVAIISDAVNNLTDAMSSVITLAGLKLSQKKPDRKHPLGYGRIEYLSAMLIAVIICVAGFEFLKTSADRILNPQAVNFSILQLVILVVAALLKLFLAKLNKTLGKAADSYALEASGAEAMIDVFASALTIVAAIIAKITGLRIDGFMGLLLSLFILYTGINSIKETISRILGERPEKELVDEIRIDLKAYTEIRGGYDFILHSYGPVTRLGTANLEFSDDLPAKVVYDTMQAAQKDILKKHGIYFTFGLYAVNAYDTDVAEAEKNVRAMLRELPYIIGIHAFYLDREHKTFSFDAVVDFTVRDFEKATVEIGDLIMKSYPDCEVRVKIDLDYA